MTADPAPPGYDTQDKGENKHFFGGRMAANINPDSAGGSGASAQTPIQAVAKAMNLPALKDKVMSLWEKKGAAADEQGAGVDMASPLRFGAADPALNAMRSRAMMDQKSLMNETPSLSHVSGQLDPSLADRQLSRRIADNPNDWQAYAGRAMAREREKHLDDAYADASKAISLNPDEPRNYRTRALIEIDRKNYPAAVLDAGTAIERYSRDPSSDPRALAFAHATRALANQYLGNTSAQVADLKRAAELDSEFEERYQEAVRQARGENPIPLPLIGTIPIHYYFSAALILMFLWIGIALLGRRFNTQFATLSRISQMGIPASPTAPGNMVAAPPAHLAHVGALTPPRTPDLREISEDFQIIRQIGRGGMGIVFEAIDVTLQRKVALKKMRDEISAEPRERKRFIKEARTVAALKHPNIIEIYSVADRPDGLYLVFEFLDGETLDDLLRRNKTLPPAEVVNWTTQIAHALDHAHRLGVVHRDLKPSNVMLSNGAAKVMDFGIARHVQDTLSTLSRGEIIGTPVYMAPEQQQGHSYKESDIYALALCAYEMLAGQVPFPTPAGMKEKMAKNYPPLRELNPAFPPAVDQVIARALEPDANARYHSASEFATALQKAVG